MEREKIAGKLMTFVPYMFKRIMKNFPAMDMSRQQMGLLFHVWKESGKPMSYYSEKLMVPKSNLSVASDKLIQEGFIDREFDPSDRRVIILSITDKGKKCLEEYKKKYEGEMAKKLEALSEAEAKRLNELIDEMQSIMNKLE